MTSRSAFKFVVTLAVVFAVVGAYGLFTVKASSANSVRGVDGRPPVASPAERIAKTVLVQGDSGAALPVGTFTLIDGASITCPASCSFGGENNQQLASNSSSNVAILTSVDGNFIGVGPYLGPVGAAPDYTAKQWADFAGPFAAGAHSLQTWVYMRDDSGTAYWYLFNYKAYKP